MNAIFIFPDEIKSVKAWHGRMDGDPGNGGQERKGEGPDDFAERGKEDALSEGGGDVEGEEEEEEVAVEGAEKMFFIRIEDATGKVHVAAAAAPTETTARALAAAEAHETILKMLEGVKKQREGKGGKGGRTEGE